MAKMTVSSRELPAEKLERMSRDMIRQVVMAGAGAAEKLMKESTRKREHVRTGDMLNSIGPGEYKESFRGGSVEIYPQGEDRHGVRNATKAYVINYGRGGTRQRTGRMGDKFITREEKIMEEAVRQAMQAESDRILEKIDKED